MRKSKLAGAIAFSLLSLNVHALSVGNMNVDSYLGEPLDVSIDISSVTEDQFSTLEVKLADREMFEKAGIDYPQNAKNLFIELGEYQNGGTQIRVQTPGAVSDPFVHLLINISWSGGNILREYTALIDPVDYQVSPIAKAVAPGTSLGVNQAAAEQSPSADDMYRTVERGDSLSAIAALYRPSDVSAQQAWMAFYTQNPHAFPDGNINNLQSGARLKVPSAAEMRAMTPQEAREEVNNLSRPLVPGAQSESQVMTGEPMVQTTPTLVVGGSGAQDESQRSTPEEPATSISTKAQLPESMVAEFSSFTQSIEQEISGARERDVQFREELIATRGENRVLTERLTNLEAQISRMTQLLELQSQALEAINTNIAGSSQQTDQVKAALEQLQQADQTAAVSDAPVAAESAAPEPAGEGEKSYYEQLLEQAMTAAPEEDKSYIESLLGEASTSIGLEDTNPVTPEMKAKAAASKPVAPASQDTEDMLANVRASLGQQPSAEITGLPDIADVEIDTEDQAYLDALTDSERSQIEQSEARIADLERQLQDKIRAAQESAAPAAPEPTETTAVVDTSTPAETGTSQEAPTAEPDEVVADEPAQAAPTASETPSPADTGLVASLMNQAKDAFNSLFAMLSGLSSDAWRVISGVGAVFIGLMLISRIRRRRSDNEEIPPASVADISFEEEAQDVGDLATQSMAQDQELDDLEEELHGSSLFDLSDESFMASEVIQDDSSLFSMDENEDFDSLANMDSEQIGQQSTMTQVVDVDPVAEADVYLAYDRKEQAIEVLSQALEKDPNQGAVVIKLLGLYQDGEDVERFSKLFESSAEHIEDDEEWAKIKTMAQDFVPGHEMLADDFDSSIPVLNEKADAIEKELADLEAEEEPIPGLSLDEGVTDTPLEALSEESLPSELDEELDSATEEINQHEPDTALALAKAYIELGEADIAKDFLQDVINADDDKLKQEAEEMLKSLG